MAGQQKRPVDPMEEARRTDRDTADIDWAPGSITRWGQEANRKVEYHFRYIDTVSTPLRPAYAFDVDLCDGAQEQDLWGLLGLKPDCVHGLSDEQASARIRNTYKRQMLKWHPDKIRVEVEEERQQMEDRCTNRSRWLNAAVDVLSDAGSRQWWNERALLHELYPDGIPLRRRREANPPRSADEAHAAGSSSGQQHHEAEVQVRTSWDEDIHKYRNWESMAAHFFEGDSEVVVFPWLQEVLPGIRTSDRMVVLIAMKVCPIGSAVKIPWEMLWDPDEPTMGMRYARILPGHFGAWNTQYGYFHATNILNLLSIRRNGLLVSREGAGSKRPMLYTCKHRKTCYHSYGVSVAVPFKGKNVGEKQWRQFRCILGIAGTEPFPWHQLKVERKTPEQNQFGFSPNTFKLLWIELHCDGGDPIHEDMSSERDSAKRAYLNQERKAQELIQAYDMTSIRPGPPPEKRQRLGSQRDWKHADGSSVQFKDTTRPSQMGPMSDVESGDAASTWRSSRSAAHTEAAASSAAGGAASSSWRSSKSAAHAKAEASSAASSGEGTGNHASTTASGSRDHPVQEPVPRKHHVEGPHEGLP